MAIPVSPPATSAAAVERPQAARIRGLDVLRGLVIVLMVIDHVRFFLSSARFDPTDPVETTTALFFTRWITHFCAPAFMLLAGAGAYLSLGRGRTAGDLSRFLLTRGLWLLLLELTVARFGWQFNLDYGYSSALVFWALGWSMIALAALVRLPRPGVAALGLIMIAGHHLFDGIEAAEWGSLAWLWTILHQPGELAVAPGIRFFVLYPLVPWIGVMAAGYAFGHLATLPAARRDRIYLVLGVTLTVGFVLLRLVNGYGDPAPWSAQATAWRTVLSFLNTTKYPASLLFLLMTLGPAIALLPALERLRGPLAELLLTLGRVPLFFWLLHVPLIHLAALGLSILRYGDVIPWLVENPPTPLPDGYGYGLAVVYAVSLAVVAALYPLCRWFAAVKRRRRDQWLSYL
jgi:uncharacterized membrane protein